jgi:hypothetical protein
LSNRASGEHCLSLELKTIDSGLKNSQAQRVAVNPSSHLSAVYPAFHEEGLFGQILLVQCKKNEPTYIEKVAISVFNREAENIALSQLKKESIDLSGVGTTKNANTVVHYYHEA